MFKLETEVESFRVESRLNHHRANSKVEARLGTVGRKETCLCHRFRGELSTKFRNRWDFVDCVNGHAFSSLEPAVSFGRPEYFGGFHLRLVVLVGCGFPT